MSWQVIRKGADHDKSVQQIIKDYVQLNWSLTAELTEAQLLFSTGWWQKQPQYQVHFRHDIDLPATHITIGRRPIHKFPDRVQVHCFATEQTDDQEPLNLDKMNREVQRIIGSDVLGLEAEGICNMFVGNPRVLPLEDSQAVIFHSIMQLGFWYMKRFI